MGLISANPRHVKFWKYKLAWCYSHNGQANKNSYLYDSHADNS